MGALTLKSFPHVLRGWEVRSYESIDPTDSFGQETRLYIDKNHTTSIVLDRCINFYNVL